MPSTSRIKEIFERNGRALAVRPSVGRGTARTTVTLRDGLTCDVEEDGWKLVVDMSKKSGGDERGPDPGVYGRTALGSCLAISYILWAAKRGITLRNLRIQIEADYDSSGLHGVGDSPPGYRQVRYIVSVDSDASREQLLALFDEADAHSPYRDIFTRPIELCRELRLT